MFSLFLYHKWWRKAFSHYLEEMQTLEKIFLLQAHQSHQANIPFKTMALKDLENSIANKKGTFPNGFIECYNSPGDSLSIAWKALYTN